MRAVPVFLGFLVPFVASSALAQFSKPTLRLSAIDVNSQQINIEKFNADTPIMLSWSATVNALESYEYEVFYEDTLNTTTSSVGLVRLDSENVAGTNQGTVQSGLTYNLWIRPSQIIEPEHWPTGAHPVDADQGGKRSIAVRVHRPGAPTDVNTSDTKTWQFTYDTKAPTPPVLNDLIVGENRLEPRWTGSVSTDVNSYSVVYCPDVSATVTASTATATVSKLTSLPCSSPVVASAGDANQTRFSVTDGLRNGVPAAVSVRGTDKLGNVGVVSNILVGTPREVTDFFELYKTEGGAEQGGFCFIATAAYGSYAHPTVRVLRAFRDIVLERTPVGTLAVWAYYHYSPPLARLVAANPALASWTRAMLLPVAALALLALALPFVGLLVLLGLVVRRRQPSSEARSVRAAAAALVVVGALAVSGSAQAIDLNRSKPNGRFGIGFELKGGPYLPAMGQDGGGPEGVPAFGKIYATRPNPLYQMGLDLQLYRGFGTLGIGGSFGFMQFVGKALFGANGPVSNDTTVFNILPLTLTAFYRFDWLADRSFIPLVPYLRGGLAYDVWWVTTGTGDISRFTQVGKSDVVGRGGKPGYTGTAGVALLLNTLDLDASRSLYDSTGIRGTYLFVEYTANKIDGFGKKGFDFSDDEWAAGISFEW